MKTITLPLRNLMNRSPLRAFLLIALGWLALAPQARGACQEGCLTIRNTVLGDDAFFSNTTGFHRSTKVCGCAPEQEIRALAATVKEQASQLQKVSAQLEVSKSAPQTIATNP